jgi:hypothetical protein
VSRCAGRVRFRPRGLCSGSGGKPCREEPSVGCCAGRFRFRPSGQGSIPEYFCGIPFDRVPLSLSFREEPEALGRTAPGRQLAWGGDTDWRPPVIFRMCSRGNFFQTHLFGDPVGLSVLVAISFHHICRSPCMVLDCCFA